MSDLVETPNDSLGITESEAKGAGLSKSDSQSIAENSIRNSVKIISDQITPFDDGDLVYDVESEVWWGNIKWRTACHGGI